MNKPTTIYTDNHTAHHFDSKAAAKKWQAEQQAIKNRNTEAIKKLHAIKIS